MTHFASDGTGSSVNDLEIWVARFPSIRLGREQNHIQDYNNYVEIIHKRLFFSLDRISYE